MPASREFYLRRLHSLTGILMGLFLFNHFLTNSFIFVGREAFNHKVHLIHYIPALPLVEFAFIALPFLFHGLYGAWIMVSPDRRGDHNPLRYGYGRNWMYTVQRVTAAILVAFVLWHVIEMRFYINYLVNHYVNNNPDAKFVLGDKFYDYLVMKFESPWFAIGYCIGVLSAVVHWANGLATFCISWGITVGPRSQRGMAVVALFVGLLYAGMAGASLYGLIFPKDPPRPIIEKDFEMYPSDYVPSPRHQTLLIDPDAEPEQGLVF